MSQIPPVNPYQAPLHSGPPLAARPSATWYESAGMRAKVLILLTAALVVLHVVSILLSMHYVGQVTGLLQQGQPPQEMVDAASTTESLQALLGMLTICLLLGAVIAYMMWIHRAYRNLPALGANGARYSPGWVVGYHFIPIMNLFRPVQAINDIWKGSDPRYARLEPRAWRHASGSPLITAWWGMWLISGAVGRASFKATLAAETLPEIRNAEYLSIVNDVAGLVAMLLAIFLVRAIQQRQEEKHHALSQGAPAETASL